MSATLSIRLGAFPNGHPSGCTTCAMRVVEHVRGIAGVIRVEPEGTAERLTCAYEPDVVSPEAITLAVEQAITDNERHWKYESIAIEGMDCADCAKSIERGLARVNGVAMVEVSFGAARMDVEYDGRRTDSAAIERVIHDLGYAVSSANAASESERTAVLRLIRRRGNLLTLASGALLIAGIAALLGGAPSDAANALFATAIAVGGVPLAMRGVRSAWVTRAPDINLLMTIAVFGAALLGDWIEGATVVFLFSLGEALEGYAMDRVRRSVRSLLSLSPSVATVVRNGADLDVPVGDVAPGDVIVIRPGQRVPLDGVVLAGISNVDQSSLTGESIPALKEPGELLFAGTMNVDGPLTIRVTRPAADSSIARIIHMVEQAQASRAPTQRLVDRFAVIYTPAVIVAAAVVALVPPLLGNDWREWIGRALVLLVIACPCALVISTPVAIVSALSAAARRGILIKGGAALERVGTIDTVALDKTGTLTLGRPVVATIVGFGGCSERDILADAATLERHSEHPLGRAIVAEASRRSVAVDEASEMRVIAGTGVVGTLRGREYRVGSRRMFDAEALRPEVEAALAAIESVGGTAVLTGEHYEVAGVIGFADELRPGAADAIRALHRAGVKHIVMLTGDRAAAAERVAVATAVDEVRAELLPEGKAAAIQAMCSQGRSVAMVGDGINDAPSLAAADVGIAMGVAGTDAAIETADIALMGDDLTGVANSIVLGKRARRTIGTNVAFSIVVKVVTLGLAVAGFASLWMAIAADVGASLLVVGNGLLLLRRRL